MSKTEELQVLTWKAGNFLFGMNIAFCREVEKDKAIVPVPHAAEHLAGIVNLRGEVVTVIDLAVLLGHGRCARGERHVIIRLKSRGQHVALMADTISDVIRPAADALEPPPAHLSETELRYITAVSLTDKGLVLVLDPTEILKTQ